MKKNWLMRTAYLVLAVLLISSVVVSGTFAKYTWSSNDMLSSAKVAKFAFAVNGTSINNDNYKTAELTLDLFKAENIKDEQADGTLADAETDVAEAGKNIAPGMGGSFDVVVVNEGEVTIEYTVTATAAASDIPVVFNTANAADGWTDDLQSLFTADTKVAMSGEGATSSKTIFWKWAFNDADDAVTENDTALGFAGTDKYEVTVSIVVDQVN